MVKGDKKLVGAYMLDILRKSTGNDYSETIEDLIKKIQKEYGIKVDDRTIRRYIKTLRNSGYDIKDKIYEKSNYNAKAYYLEKEENETFSDSEVRYIIDSIIFSKHIDRKVGKKIIDKFRDIYSNQIVESLEYVNNLKVDNINKFYNSYEFFNKIEMLHKIIRERQRIEIDFNEYTDENENKTIKINKIV